MWPFNLFKPKTKHHAMDSAVRHFRTLDDGNPIDHYEFVVLDCELTGLNARKGEIVTIGAVRIKSLHIILNDCFYSCVKTKKKSLTDAVLIHRITPEVIQSAPDLEIVLPEFVEFCGNSVLVGHGIDIDMAFLNRGTEKIFGSRLPNPCLDTMNLTRFLRRRRSDQIDLDPRQSRRFDLTSISNFNKLPSFQAHNALEDAIQTACLFLYLIHYLRQEGLVTLADLCDAKSETAETLTHAY